MVYKFRCEDCGKEGTLECTMKEYDELKDALICDDCSGKMKRVFEAFEGGIEFKGRGFYNTENNVVAKWQ